MTGYHNEEKKNKIWHCLKVFLLSFLFNSALIMSIFLGFDYLAASLCHLPFAISPMSIVLALAIGLANGIYALIHVSIYRLSEKA